MAQGQWGRGEDSHCVRVHLHFLGSHSYPLITYSWKHCPGAIPDSRRMRLKAESQGIRQKCFQQMATHCPVSSAQVSEHWQPDDGSGPLSHRGHIPDIPWIPRSSLSPITVSVLRRKKGAANPITTPLSFLGLLLADFSSKLHCIIKSRPFTFSLQRSIS